MKKILHSNNYLGFLFKFFVFIVVVAIADFSIGKLLEKKYFNQSHGEDALTTYAIKEVKTQMLVFGSSRAVNIFDPSVLENETGLSCFNAGRVGQSIFYHYAVLKSTLKRYSPEVIILSLDAWDFAKDESDYDRISSLLPYYNTCTEVRDVVHLRGPFEKLKMGSSIYPYNSLLLPIIKGNRNAVVKKEIANGYVSLDKVFPGPVQTINFNATAKELDIIKVNTYISFINECKSRGIALYIVCPPYMINPVGKNLSLTKAEQIAKQYNVPYFDFAYDNNFIKRRQLFADFRHLNLQGSQEFSRIISEKISGKQPGDVSMYQQ
ncbi:MAG: hypothetical protein V4685_05880 [Bacteroidota bacterium]